MTITTFLKNRIAPLVALLLLSGCTANEVMIQEPDLPAAVYLSRPAETEKPEPEPSASATGISGEEAAPSQKETPTPAPKGTITLLGANMVYTGESFIYTYRLAETDEPVEPGEIVWECDGDAGEITADGEFFGLKKGTAALTVTDRAHGISDTLTIHVVDTAADVDFVPEVNGIPIANKTYPLPPDYDPGDLLPEAYDAYVKLVTAAAEDGIEITFISGYRSYWYQQSVHEKWIERYDEETADRLSARAGHSEHQLGLAIDVNSLLLEFADTPEAVWLRENCARFGFILRYPLEKEAVTGYMYEPWHIRYLGVELAEEVTESGLSLEEYLGIDSYYRPTPTEENEAPEETNPPVPSEGAEGTN
ncbi:MAG: M15 family metallopeptidase [Bacteroides sp.]|nr:M15 family metallopeptidase [Eubacterium sp.]MCM1419011.1 M15 family metallopeptidase [Roseburia sp.]MCM1462867.1 M15 family metallopeptidase [Bacteroides sp.]